MIKKETKNYLNKFLSPRGQSTHDMFNFLDFIFDWLSMILCCPYVSNPILFIVSNEKLHTIIFPSSDLRHNWNVEIKNQYIYPFVHVDIDIT